MAYTTIDDGSEHFTTTLYTGNGSDAHSITNSANSGNFKPDWLWTKNRTGTVRNHSIFDSNRGVQKYVYANTTASEATASSSLQSFDTNGFTVGTSTQLNPDGNSMVAWQWKANGGTTSSNTDGSITSTVQANTTAGFSIVTYSGNQTNDATVGHGLGTAPQVVIIKERNGTSSWVVKHTSLTDAGYYLILEADNAQSTAANVWNDTDPSSTVFTLGDNTSVNENNLNYVAYCFAEIEGYSKFGSYTGNGDADGVFVYTGFKPAWIMLKRTDGTNDWILFDNKRLGYNGDNKRLYPNQTYVEDTTGFDLLSNGFKARMTGTTINGSGNSYVYMALAEHPFVSSKGVPVTAR